MYFFYVKLIYMVVIIVILVFVSILSGMALSIWAFGTGSKRAKIFEDIYFSVEDVENKGIIYTKKGDYSAVLEMENPIKKYSADTDSYYDFTTLMASVIQVLGEGYALHKQDVFVRKNFDMSRVALILLLHKKERKEASTPTITPSGEISL